jgi:serine/threonine protein kinase
MHSMGFAHLDIKPANILRAECAQNAFKLADFGNVMCKDSIWEIIEGDRIYVSGELLAGDHANIHAADIFSLGITVLELVMRSPLPEDGPEYTALRHGDIPPQPREYSQSLWTLIKVCPFGRKQYARGTIGL